MHTMHLLPGVAIQPNLELKTQPKQLLGSLPLVIALPGTRHYPQNGTFNCKITQPRQNERFGDSLANFSIFLSFILSTKEKPDFQQ